MTNMQELIERLEKATGPDRGLDAAIGYAIGELKEYLDPMDRFGTLVGVEYKGKQHALFAPWWPNPSVADRRGDLKHIALLTRLPSYTASIDAALTLVPKDAFWEVGKMHGDNSPMRNFGSVYQYRARCGGWGYPQRSDHNSSAIALCIAALKARAEPKQ